MRMGVTRLGETRFKKPVKILHVFRMVHEYGKDEKSYADRKDKLAWQPVLSASGYVAEGLLYLPEAIQDDPKFNNCRLITIEDAADITPQQEWKLINGAYERGNNHCFNLHYVNSYEFFGLAKDPLELSLRYSNSLVGDPSRDNFTLAILEKDIPVEVKINGKHDTSRGRHFEEQYYIFHYLGEFDRCYLVDMKEAPVVKKVPGQRKMVDLLKPLW